ncbi:MAG: hypothetical protein GY861_04120, partial [bacterium]|nr:hypothetical protein [bacterium]
VLIVVVALSVYLPALFLSTSYNFIYTSCDSPDRYSYRCGNYLQQIYSVKDGELIVNSIDPEQDSDNDGVLDINEGYNARIFLHNTEKNESREITLKEAQTLKLDNLLTSPDGITFTDRYDKGGDILLFDGGSNYGHYLTKGNSKVKLNLINNDDRYYYQNNFQFLGWILPGRN